MIRVFDFWFCLPRRFTHMGTLVDNSELIAGVWMLEGHILFLQKSHITKIFLNVFSKYGYIQDLFIRVVR